MKNIVEKIISEVSLDERITDGIFTIENNDHMDVLRDYLNNKGIEKSVVTEFCNGVLEGKYPERQAYNANGILVTFPTPEYKQRALQRKTHFEKDPTKAAPNVFGGGEQPTQDAPAAPGPPADSPPTDPAAPAPDAPTTPPADAPAPEGGSPAPPADTSAPKTNLPLSKSASQVTGDTEVPTTDVAPEAEPEEPESEPIEPTELPPPEPKPEAEKEADKDIIKKMLQGDDYKLEAISEWLSKNGPTHIFEWIKEHKRHGG